jgi:DNA mismatch repair protein MSH6
VLFTLRYCVRLNTASQRIKRKISAQDSDDDGSTLAKTSGRTKKQRISRVPSEEPEEDEEIAIGKRAFTEKLQRFKKPPQKVQCMRCLAPHVPLSSLTIHADKKRKPADDDDNFIVPDDASDLDAVSIPSDGDRRSTSRSSARSVSGLDTDEDGEDEVPNRKKMASKPSGKSQRSNAAAAPSSSPFLTAAERSMQDKKLEKKSVDKPFNFLQDVKDKDGVRPGEPGYDPRTIYVPKSSWAEFTPFEKQV